MEAKSMLGQCMEESEITISYRAICDRCSHNAPTDEKDVL